VSLEQVSLLVFFACIVVGIAVWMVFRDLIWGSNNEGGIRPRILRRSLTVQDQEPSLSVTGKLDQEFEHLVLESGLDTTTFSAFLMILASGLIAGGSVFLYKDNVMLASMAGAAGMLFPLGCMMFWRSRRMREMQENMPYIVDLLARAIRAGESVDQAVELVGTETKGTVGKEFTRCSHQLQMGLGLGTVMRSLTRRIRLTELRMLASTLMVHRQTGGNLPLALDRMAGVIRDRMNAIRQMRASTGAGRSSTLLMAIVSPIAYLICFLYFPDHVKPLLTDMLGRFLLMIAICLEVLGIIWVLALLKKPA